MNRFTLSLLVVLALALALPGFGQNQPSAKATAAVADINLLSSTSVGAGSSDDDTVGWSTILANNIKTANQKDLFIDASLECGIYSDTLVRSSGGITDASLASGGVRVRVVVDPATPNDGAAPGPNGFYASPSVGYDVSLVDNDSDGVPDDAEFAQLSGGSGVSFCKRIQYLSAKLQGIIETLGCFVDDDNDPETPPVFDPDAEGCVLTDEEIRLILATLDANSFNFIAENLSSGVHRVEVQAKLDTSAAAQKGSASAKAFVGMGSVTIEEVRMIKNEDITYELQ